MKKGLKENLITISPFIGILLIIVTYFFHLFFPQPQLFYTPDFGRSDIWNFNYPIKDFLAQSLKKGQLPFWSQKVATGFPFLAEGQIGALNIFNLILFYLFPTWVAWNLSYLIIFFLSFLGTYLFLKQNHASCFASFLAGFIFSFGGFFVCHISHFNLIQASSFLPWLFLTLQNLLEKPKKKNLFLFCFVLSQQIFSGHPQMTFISLVGICFFALYKIFEKNDKKLIAQKLIFFFLALFLAFCLASPQIMPTLELTSISSRKGGLNQETIFKFPYPLRHLLTFILPNFFGTPKNGSYPPFGPGWGIYWENTAYLGIIPLLLAALAIFFQAIFYRRCQAIQPPMLDDLATSGKLKKFFVILLILSLLLVLGQDSPLYFLFSFPAFNLFRVPSRFLLLTAFSISVLAAFGFDQLTCLLKRKIKNQSLILITIYCLLLTAVFDLFSFGYSYHPLVPVSQALQPPESWQYIKPDERIYSDNYQMKLWNDFFVSHGWQDISPFLYFKNGLSADLNLVFDRTNIEAFYGLPSARQEYFQTSLNRKLINAASAKFLITPQKIEDEKKEDYQLVKTIAAEKNSLPSFYLYQNLVALPRFRFVSDYKVEKTLNGFFRTINADDFSFDNTVALEKEPTEKFEKLTLAKIKLLKDENQKIVLQTNTDQKTLLVVADSYYPGWQAKIDGQKTEILPANLNQRAIILPSGKHTVEMEYYPKKFYQGVLVSLVSLFAFIFLNFPKKASLFQSR